jgi:exopolysaccharide biosynthesis polyprenyl glycosylphosphotransferase
MESSAKSVAGDDRKFLIVGAGWAGQTMAEVLLPRMEILGFLDDRVDELTSCNIDGHAIAVVADTKNILNVAQDVGATDIVVAITHKRKDYVLSGIVECMEAGLIVHQMPELYGQITGKIPLKHIDEHWIAPKMREPEKNIEKFLVEAVDYMATIMLLLFVYLPLLPIVFVGIKLTSPGPIYFYQKRVGYRGRRFTIIKFRTMSVNARSEGASWTVENDNRITWFGSFLRKFRIDELPQLINVLKGEMSLVGPRPEAMDLVSMYKKEIPFYEFRNLVKPGITGWAQVCYRNTCSVDGALEKLQYDLYWIKRRSLGFHIKVILKTIKVTMTGFGSV